MQPMTPFCRFALYDYQGNAKAFYLVHKRELLEDEDEVVAPQAAHHIFVVDRSGSMYHDITAVRVMMEKLLTLSEYRDSSMLVTLISYSSKGDCTVHFSRKTCGEIMRPGSAEVEAIRQIRVTGLTCISQALEMARTFIDARETTGISLHSDGYANDASPATERREIDRICEELTKIPGAGVFVNTIAYSPYSDFKLLSGIANGMNGKCVQATSAKEVFDALHDTSSLLSGRTSPAVQVQIGDAEYFTFVSRSARRVNGSPYDTIVMGLQPSDDKTVYWFTRVTYSQYLDSGFPIANTEELLQPTYSFAMAKLSEGQLNTAKFAMIATRDSDLIRQHYRALTSPDLAALHAALEPMIFELTPRARASEYGLGFRKMPVMHLLDYLNANKEDLQIYLPSITENYTRQGLQLETGVRKEDGTIEERETKARFKPGWDPNIAKIAGFDLNNNTASINVLCERPIQIWRPADGPDPILSVAGVDLDELSRFNNYTLVSDGLLNVPSFDLKIKNKRIHRQLVHDGILPDETFDPIQWYTIELEGLPLVDFSSASLEAADLSATFLGLAKIKSLISLLTALLAGKSDRFTPEQLTALGEHDITGSLYHSPPRTVPYTDKTEALNSGLIDSRISYKIDLGSTKPQILSRGQLHSGNAMLKQFYTASVLGVELTDLKWPLWWDTSVTFWHKKLSARTKITPIDGLMKPLYDAFLGLGPIDPLLETFFSFIGPHLDPTDIELIRRIPKRELHPDRTVEILTAVLEALRDESENLFGDVRPLVFYIGATGLLPDEMNAEALTADQVTERFPDLKIGSKEKDGTFFLLEDGALISVYATSVTFTVDPDKRKSA